MDQQLAKKMDEAMIGARLFCEVCSKSKILSPCYRCQSKGNELKEYCRGCSFRYSSCKREREICKASRREKLLMKINETFDDGPGDR